MKKNSTVYATELTTLWSWLPAFRVVAETEHLPSAAKVLHVTPSALSRSIRLLEDELGELLFERRGRRLALLPAGERLLEAVRLAMRTVHDGVSDVRQDQIRGVIRVYAPAPFFGAFVLPAIARLKATFPLVTPILAGHHGPVGEALVRGEIDLALTDDPVNDERVRVRVIGTLRHHVACADGHPLTRCDGASLASAVARAPFAAPVADEEGRTPDAWPDVLPRQIALRVAQMFVAVDAVRSGGYVAILPDRVSERAGLVALPYPEGVETPLYLVDRVPLTTGRRSAAEVLGEAIAVSV